MVTGQGVFCLHIPARWGGGTHHGYNLRASHPACVHCFTQEACFLYETLTLSVTKLPNIITQAETAIECAQFSVQCDKLYQLSDYDRNKERRLKIETR